MNKDLSGRLVRTGFCGVLLPMFGSNHLPAAVDNIGRLPLIARAMFHRRELQWMLWETATRSPDYRLLICLYWTANIGCLWFS